MAFNMKVEEGKTSHSQEAIGQIWQTKMSTQASVVSIEAVCIALSLLAELNRMLIMQQTLEMRLTSSKEKV